MTTLPRFAVLLGLALGAAAPGVRASEEPSPPPPPAGETADEAEAAAAAAREREAKAAAETRALEKDLAAKEEALDAAREAGDGAAIARCEAEVEAASAALATHLLRVPRRLDPKRPVRIPAAPSTPYRATEGLPPVRPATGRAAEDAIGDALDWLARHQQESGHWDADGSASRCSGTSCPGPGGPLYDPGLSGLALCAFLSSGETHKTMRHGAVVRNGLKYLKGIQDAEGCFGPRTSNHFIYNHALATLAMANAYGLTQSPLFRESVEGGVRFALQAQNPYLAWRYGVRPQDNDTSVTSWMVLALAYARQAGIPVDDQAFSGTLAWLDKVTEPEYGRAGYTARGNGPARPQELIDAFPSDRSEALTAAAVTMRFLCGQGAADAYVAKGLDLCARILPAWDETGSVDFYYWFFGTLAARRAGGGFLEKWEPALREALLPRQRGEESGCARGSWDPVDPWGADGGRVYATALNAMALRCLSGYRRVEGGK
jgi:hypothetical protein